MLKLAQQGMAGTLREGLDQLLRCGMIGRDFRVTPGAQAVLDFYGGGLSR